MLSDTDHSFFCLTLFTILKLSVYFQFQIRTNHRFLTKSHTFEFHCMRVALELMMYLPMRRVFFLREIEMLTVCLSFPCLFRYEGAARWCSE